MALFHIEDLSFSYPHCGRNCLDRVSLTVNPGEYVLLCGKSGCGKTTLLRHLKSVLTPYGDRSGQVRFLGQPLEEVPQQAQAAKIGFVMQNPDSQIVTDKVWHELAFGLENLGVDPTVMRTKVAEMACYFGIQDWFHRDVALLSGGQKQLLNLASVMAMQPEVLILDEPTSQLDPIAASDFLNTVRKINLELGTTVIITEHRLEDIFPYVDRAVVMEDGRIIADGAPAGVGRFLWQERNDMFRAMPTPMQVFCGSGASGESPLTIRQGRNWLSGLFETAPHITALPARERAFSAETALELKDLWFRYERDGRDILRGVEVSVPKGCIFSIVGGNGAGKSTTLKAICGICKPYRGKVRIFGKAPKAYGSTLFRGCVAMLPQDPQSLFAKDTVEAELTEMSGDTEKIAATAALCGISHLLAAHPYDLSGGEQQRAALAKVLLTDPRLLLLDEPTKGIDNFFKEQLASLLQALRDRGVTVILVSHDVEFCAKYADFVSMFFDGQILTTDTPRRFFGANSFYTTAANRMSRHVFRDAVTASDMIALLGANKEQTV